MHLENHYTLKLYHYYQKDLSHNKHPSLPVCQLLIKNRVIIDTDKAVIPNKLTTKVSIRAMEGKSAPGFTNIRYKITIYLKLLKSLKQRFPLKNKRPPNCFRFKSKNNFQCFGVGSQYLLTQESFKELIKNFKWGIFSPPFT